MLAVADPYDLNITRALASALRAAGLPSFRPYFVGDTYKLRTRWRNAADLSAINFTGAKLVWLLKTDEDQPDAEALITKSSTAGGITIDSQITDPGVPANNTTGRGWVEILLDKTDQAVLLQPAIEQRLRYHELRVEFADGSWQVLMRGEFEINPPRVRAPNV